MHKVVGVGPIVRLAARAANSVVSAPHSSSRSGAPRDTNHDVTGSRSMPFSRSDWNGGRCIEAEEAQCGMLVRLTDLYPFTTHGVSALSAAQSTSSLHVSMSGTLSPAHARRRVTSSEALVQTPFVRIRALIKAQPADFQVNELACPVDGGGMRTDAAVPGTHTSLSEPLTSDAETRKRSSGAESGAFLIKAPKGRWRKITRNHTVPVEDTRESFRNPDKTFTPRVLRLGSYVRRLGKLSEANAALHFVLYREAYSVNQVLHRLHYELGIDDDAVRLRELAGGFFGCVSQYGLCVGVTAEALVHASRHYHLRLLLFDPRRSHGIDELKHTASPMLLQPSALPAGGQGATFYRVMLRFVEADKERVAQALRHLKEVGFVNYFGVERLGVGSSGVHHMASLLGRGATARAVGAYLQTLAESDSFHYDYFLAYVNAEESTAAAAVATWRRACQAARLPRALSRLLDALHHYHTLCVSGNTTKDAASKEKEEQLLQHMWRLCPVQARCKAAAAEFVWNAMASQRLLRGGYRVVVGDVVCESDRLATALPPRYRRVCSEAEAAQYGMAEVVLPVPYGKVGKDSPNTSFARGVNVADYYPHMDDSVSLSLYRRFAQQHGLSTMLFGAADDLAKPAHGTDETMRRACAGAEETKVEVGGGVPDTEAVRAEAPSLSWSATTAWDDAGVVYRALIGKPYTLQAAVLHDPRSYAALKSDAFLMQERKSTQSVELDFAERVREPCVYNVSERFAERMAHVRQCMEQRPAAEAYHGPLSSVALSFVLPAEASPLVALRDVFALRYANFNDLYAIHGPC